MGHFKKKLYKNIGVKDKLKGNVLQIHYETNIYILRLHFNLRGEKKPSHVWFKTHHLFILTAFYLKKKKYQFQQMNEDIHGLRDNTSEVNNQYFGLRIFYNETWKNEKIMSRINSILTWYIWEQILPQWVIKWGCVNTSTYLTTFISQFGT